jgi:predicted transcriptional regulator
MNEYKLHETEYKFVSIIWDNEPLGSGELVKFCNTELGWKKSTTYTVLKKLSERGILQNKDAVVTSLVKREEVQKYESEKIIDRVFDGSLPQFISAFMGDKKLDKHEAEKIKKLIDSYKE